ncbi:MAG: nucleotide exchange factor GrpE, partial [Acutalibacteraceae bacterium]|nr:nucleotide exchange factor GrpE [Acutalibacteraceae bacterium]
ASTVDKDSPDYAKGIEMIVKMLGDAVKDLGLQEIGAVGDTFDPNLHEAVMHIEDENFGENTICNVLQKGYKFGDTVIRPAMVQVAN